VINKLSFFKRGEALFRSRRLWLSLQVLLSNGSSNSDSTCGAIKEYSSRLRVALGFYEGEGAQYSESWKRYGSDNAVDSDRLLTPSKVLATLFLGLIAAAAPIIAVLRTDVGRAPTTAIGATPKTDTTATSTRGHLSEGSAAQSKQ